MKRKTCLPLVFFGAMLGAQVPHFSDGSALGASKVFCEGLNPMGSCARFPKARPGFYLTWVDGDQSSPDNKSGRENLNKPFQAGSALTTLHSNPWGQRTRAYGLAWADQQAHSSLTHEEYTSLWMQTDLDHLSGNLELNSTFADLRRVVVDRLAVGAGDFQNGTGRGVLVRIERWRWGQSSAYFNPGFNTEPLLNARDPLDFKNTSKRATTLAIDAAFEQEVVTGLRFGIILDRILAKKFYDLEEKPQIRAGFQLDLGSMASLSLESDINSAMRMPLPVKKKQASATLRITPNSLVSLVLGASRLEMADQALFTGGATLWVNLAKCRIGSGFQFSKDRPMKGLTVGFL